MHHALTSNIVPLALRSAEQLASGAPPAPAPPYAGDFRGLKALPIILLDKLARKLGILDDSQGLGCANTALVYHAGQLLALHEGDAPYALRLLEGGGPMRTLGRRTFGGRLAHPFTAHPKLDPVTKVRLAAVGMLRALLLLLLRRLLLLQRLVAAAAAVVGQNACCNAARAPEARQPCCGVQRLEIPALW